MKKGILNSNIGGSLESDDSVVCTIYFHIIDCAILCSCKVYTIIIACMASSEPISCSTDVDIVDDGVLLSIAVIKHCRSSKGVCPSGIQSHRS